MSVLDRLADTVNAARTHGANGASAKAREASAPAMGASQLSRRRDRLARRLAELQWDLGGLSYEMAIRDHFRLDVLTAQAAKLQEVDAELGEVERLLQLEEAAATGSCPSCGALHSRGASFCWRCGTQLLEAVAPE